MVADGGRPQGGIFMRTIDDIVSSFKEKESIVLVFTLGEIT